MSVSIIPYESARLFLELENEKNRIFVCPNPTVADGLREQVSNKDEVRSRNFKKILSNRISGEGISV